MEEVDVVEGDDVDEDATVTVTELCELSQLPETHLTLYVVVTLGLTVALPFLQTTLPVEQLALKTDCPPEVTVAGLALALVGELGTLGQGLLTVPSAKHEMTSSATPALRNC